MGGSLLQADSTYTVCICFFLLSARLPEQDVYSDDHTHLDAAQTHDGCHVVHVLDL
jgi:hypothetical protein